MRRRLAGVVAALTLCAACSMPAAEGPPVLQTRASAPASIAEPLDPLDLTSVVQQVSCLPATPEPEPMDDDPSASTPSPDSEPTTGLSVPGATAFDASLPPAAAVWSGTKHYVAVLRCGDGWIAASDSLVVIGPGPRVVAQVLLPGSGRDDERGVVDALTPSDDGLVVRWHTTTGCCSALEEFEADLTSVNGHPELSPPRSVVRDESLDVTRFGSAQFMHPLGAVACSLQVGEGSSGTPSAACGIDFRVLQDSEICGGEAGVVIGISVAQESGFQCGHGVAVTAELSEWNSWLLGTDFPVLNGSGQGYAVLPVGASLRAEEIMCSSAPDGVRCTNLNTGSGIWVSADGTQLRLEAPVD